MLTVAVLGPVDVRRDGVQLAVPAGKTTEVLVRLALDAGAVVRSERLIEDLWSEQARGVARNTLQSKVSRLRRVLGDPGALTGSTAGYALNLDPGGVDALEVLRLGESAAALRQAGDAAAVVRTCTTALAMFRGEVLPSAGDGEWLAPHRARLEAARLRLTEDHLGARLDLGAAGELVGEIEQLVSSHPLREGLWKLLITALYRGDRQAEALAAYRRLQARLADELGLDPSADLQILEQQVLRHDPGLDAGPALPSGPALAAEPVRGAAVRVRSSTDEPAVDVAASSAERTRGNLPVLAASLVGREPDLAKVTSLVGEHRLVTVVGPAGVGKTRLATEVAREVATVGGAWLVRLESATTAGSVWHGIGEVFDVNAASQTMVLDRLRGADLLLVLDNCEQLVEVLVETVDSILGAAPRLRVLATSQLPLGLDGEAVYPLAPLTVADSVVLFTERAERQRASFALDVASVQVLETVCRSLDGLPLAIELAAARVKVLSVQEIARRLDDRFTLLSDPTSHRPPRQRALGAAIAWSYDLLFPDDQHGLWALACFRGGAPLPAVENVLAALGIPTAAVVDVVARLADRSLVSSEVAVDGTVRYRLLESVRAFSMDRLRESGMAEDALAAHASWFAAAATRAANGIHGRGQVEHLSFVRTERANIDAALSWSGSHDPALGLRIANGFGWAWILTGAGVDRAERIRAVVAAASEGAGAGAIDGTGSAPDRAGALLVAGWLEAAGGDVDRATADIEQAMRRADHELLSVGRLYLAFVRTVQNRPREALSLLEGCRADLQRQSRVWEEGGSWLLAAWAEIALGETARGKAACDEAVRLLSPMGDRWALLHAEAILGQVAQAEHRFADAYGHLERAAQAAHQLGFSAAAAYHLTNLGRAQHRGGEHRDAVRSLQRAVEAALANGDQRTAAMARAWLGRVLRVLGGQRSARAQVHAAHEWYVAAGGGDGAVLAGYLLAALDADDGAPAATHDLDAALAAARLAGDVEVEILALDTLARVHAEHADTTKAMAMLDAATALMPSARHLLTSEDRVDRDKARALLGRRSPG